MTSALFDYEVLTEEQAMKARYQLLDDGDYPATIKNIVPRVSSSGNNMYEVDLDVYDVNGSIHQVKDYWIFSHNMSWKVIHAADSCGLLSEYKEKKFTPNVIKNKNCVVSIRTQEGKEIPQDKLQGKAVGSKYPTKNVVDDYVKKSTKSILSNNSVSNSADIDLNDSIPF